MEQVFYQKSVGLIYGMSLYASGYQSSRSIEQNYSAIFVQAEFKTTNRIWTSSYTSYLEVYWHDNRENIDKFISSIPISSVGYNSSYYANGWVNVYHNSDGNLSGYVIAKFVKGGTSSYTPNTVSVNTDWTALWGIPRTSSFDIQNNMIIGNTYRISINKSVESFRHVLSYTFRNFRENINSIANKADTFIDWTIPTKLLKLITNGSEDSVRIFCDTYNGDTKIGTSYIDRRLIVDSNLKPIIEWSSLSDGNEIIKNANLGLYLNNKSYPMISLITKGIEDSVISKYAISINSEPEVVYENLDALNLYLKNKTYKMGVNEIAVYVIDSRTHKSEIDKLYFKNVEYGSPNVNKIYISRCKNLEGVESGDGTIVKITAECSSSKIEKDNQSINNIYIKVRYKSHDSEQWSNFINVFNGENYIYNSNLIFDGEFLTSKRYIFEIYIYDNIEMIEAGYNGSDIPNEVQLNKFIKINKEILTGFDLINFHPSGNSIAFGKKSEALNSDKMIEIRMDDIKIEGATIWYNNKKFLWYEESE